jgi:putative transposase
MPDPFPDEVVPQDWEEARRRADAIREFLRRTPHGSTIDEISAMLGVPAQPEALSLLQHI